MQIQQLSFLLAFSIKLCQITGIFISWLSFLCDKRSHTHIRYPHKCDKSDKITTCFHHRTVIHMKKKKTKSSDRLMPQQLSINSLKSSSRTNITVRRRQNSYTIYIVQLIWSNKTSGNFDFCLFFSSSLSYLWTLLDWPCYKFIMFVVNLTLSHMGN